MKHTPKYAVSKTFGHDLGLTCTFRQWRAQSHCRFLHGYALSFKFDFVSDELDNNNWVIDFGKFKSLRGEIEAWFDHTTIIQEDDPELSTFKSLNSMGLINLRVLPRVSCESFANFAFGLAAAWLLEQRVPPSCRLRAVTVAEHGANSATVTDRHDG